MLAAVVAVLVVAVGGAVWWYLRDDSPPKVDLGTAAKGVTSTTTPRDTGGGVPSSAPTGIDGTWQVDTTTGSYDFESATGSFVGFRIQENLANVGSTTAVGRTNSVKGSLTIAGDVVTTAELTVDMTKITTNRSMRDRRVQEALDTATHPTATFELTEPIRLPADADSGKQVDVSATGDLTIHGVTKSVAFPLQAKLVNGTVVVVGSIDVTFSDYGVKVPSAPIVVSADDHGTLELQLLFTRA